MTRRPPAPFRALAAATTPVVAAAVVTVALLATGCEQSGPGSPAAASPPPAAHASAAPSPWAPAALRLLVATGLPGAPRAVAHDPAAPAAALPLALPADLTALAAIAAAPEGTLALVAPDGRAWVATGVGAPWRKLTPAAAPGGLPGQVLGAAWAADGEALLVAAGAPGSGSPRSVIATLPLDGSAGRTVEVPFEPDGPGLVPLPDGAAALVVRDTGDRGALAVVTAAGTATVFPVGARAIAEGGGLIAVSDDAGVLVVRVEELLRGALPAARLPVRGPGAVGSLAVAPDGSVVAVVRLDDTGDADRVETYALAGRAWAAGPTLPLDGQGAALVAWAGAP